MGKKKKKLLGVEDLPILDPKYNEDNLPPEITEFLETQFSIHNPLPERLTKPVLSHELVSGNMKDMGGRGDIVVLVGGEKAGKSAVVGAFISSAYTNNPKYTFGFNLAIDDGNYIVHVDSEQSKKSRQAQMKRIIKTSGFPSNEDLPNYLNFSSSIWSYQDRLTQVDYLCHKYGKKIDILILDMITDYVVEANDAKGSAHLINELVKWANMCECLVLCTIHFTKDTDRLTGVVGRDLFRKAANVIEVKHNAETNLKRIKTYRDSRIGDQLPKLEFRFNKKRLPVLYNKEKES